MYIRYLLENNNKVQCNEQDIADVLKKIRDLNKWYEKVMDYEGKAAQDYLDWDILIDTKNLFKQLKKDLADSYWGRIRFVLNDDLKAMMEEYLEDYKAGQKAYQVAKD